MFPDSPIRRLPIELLARIFVLGTNYDYPYDKSPFLFTPDGSYEPPSVSFQIAVSLVCRSWRNIAISTPCLWSCIHFFEKVHLKRAKTFLARSAPRNPHNLSSAHLLDILICTVAPDEQENNRNLLSLSQLNKIFHMLTQEDCTRRWRSFHLYVRDEQCKLAARRCLSSCGPAPNLETLQLFHFEAFRTPDDLLKATYRPPVICFDNNVPRLNNISLMGVNMPWQNRDSNDNFKMNHLESIQLALHPNSIRPPYSYWENLLQHSPELQYLSLHYSGPRKHDSSDPATFWPLSPFQRLYYGPGDLDMGKPRVISLPALKHLSLTDLEESGYACDILERLSCENLETLKLGVLLDRELEFENADFTELVELIIGIKPSTYPVHYSTTFPPACGASLPLVRSPLPNIQRKLHTLILSTFVCSFSSFRALMETLVELKVLELDFHGLHLLEGQTTKEVWPLFVSDHSSFTNRDKRDPSEVQDSRPPAVILPQLQRFAIRGLAGEHIIDIIKSRSRASRTRSLHCTRDSCNVPHETINVTLPRYVMRVDQKVRTKDMALDLLVTERGVYIHSLGEGEDDFFLPVDIQWINNEGDDQDSDESDTEED